MKIKFPAIHRHTCTSLNCIRYEKASRYNLQLYRHGSSSTTGSVSPPGSGGDSSYSGGPTISPDVPKAYDPSFVEEKLLEKWSNRKSKERANAPVFRMILPPPNVTGKLHLGHSLTLALEDTIARWKVMNGYKLEWIPGFDHAGIATHSVVTRTLLKKTSNGSVDLQKELKRFAEDNRQSIRRQLESTGALLDWNSTYYTLDEGHSLTVREAFVQLFESELIRRGDGLVNWSCALQSSVADVEVDEVDFKGKTTFRVPGHENLVEFGVLYFCAYPIENSSEYLMVATSRPETMFGDVALAVNPNDSRYVSVIGKNVINPINQHVLPVIVDPRVKTDFGSGVVKITPAHDKLDFAIGQTHNLTKLNVFTTDGFLNENANGYKGMTRFDARKAVLEHLDNVGALKGSRDYSGSLGLCNRTGDIIEPRVLPHWFLQTQFLTNEFISAIKSGSFIISPDHHSQHLINHLSNPKDWCLSRQIQWGHPIPAYYHKDHPDQWVSAMDTTSAKKKLERKLDIHITSESDIVQDTDVLDTWFSSALIPLSLSGWPDSEDLKEISLMETGNDILLFWVWRMVIMTLGLVNKFPFNQVLLHGIVTDHYGRKMSKSKGNVIDPIHVTKGISIKNLLKEAKTSLDSGELQQNEYDLRVSALQKDYPEGFKACGTDALRFALLSQDIFTQDIKMDTKYLENCRHFSNKLWQAMRFYMMYAAQNNHRIEIVKPTNSVESSIPDQWLLACLFDFAEESEKHLDKARFHLYAESIRKFFYQQLCDVYIELVKNDLKLGINAKQHLEVMRFAIETGLKISHPLIPFVTEEIWSHLTNNQNGLLIDQEFPSSADLSQFQNTGIHDLVAKTMQIVKEIRSIKTRIGVKSKTKPLIYLEIPASGNADLLTMAVSMEMLSGSQIKFESLPEGPERVNFFTVFFQLDGCTCKLSTKRDEAVDSPAVSVDQDKILKMQKKLSKLKEHYESAKFQKTASPTTKEKFRKKVELLEIKINECSFPSSPDENSQTP